MRRAFAPLVVGLVTAGLLLSGPAASAGKVGDSITGYTVRCAGTWTDPGTHKVYAVYGLTVTFTHAGQRELRVYEKTATGYTDSDHRWFSGTGTDTFTGSVTGGLVGQTVSFDVFILTRQARSLVPTASVSTGTYSC